MRGGVISDIVVMGRGRRRYWSEGLWMDVGLWWGVWVVGVCEIRRGIVMSVNEDRVGRVMDVVVGRVWRERVRDDGEEVVKDMEDGIGDCVEDVEERFVEILGKWVVDMVNEVVGERDGVVDESSDRGCDGV